jgi:DNA polymerase III subunit beta
MGWGIKMTQEIFSASVTSLRLALKEMARVIEKRNSIAVLGYVRFEAGSPVHMSGTDLDQWLTVYVDGSASQEINAPFAALSKLVDGADCARVTAHIVEPATDAKEGLICWTVGDMSAELPMVPMRELPVLPADLGAYEVAAELGADMLLPTLDAVLHSVSSEETRYYLQGINLCGEGLRNEFALVSTDGHRLTRIVLENMTWGGSPLIWPTASAKTVRALTKAQKGGAVQIKRGNEAGLFFQGLGWHFYTKTIDGSFPDYTRVIPDFSKVTGQSKLDCAEIQTKTKKLQNLVGKGAAMLLDCTEGKMTAKSDEVKSAAVTFTATAFRGAGPCAAFGCSMGYMIEAMGAVKLFSDTACLSVAESGDPMRIEPMAVPDGLRVTVVVMPRRY